MRLNFCIKVFIAYSIYVSLLFRGLMYMDKVSSQWIYLMYFNVILSKMPKETPKIQSKLTDLEKVGWTRLGHRLSLVSFGVFISVFS